MKSKSILFLLLSLLNFTSPKFLKNGLISFKEDDAIATITKDDEESLCEAINILKKNGGTIYINTPIIHISTKCQVQLSGSLAGGLVGIKQSNDEYPILDFTEARNAGSKQGGIKINGSNQFIKYLIIENAGNKGIWITGNKNTIDHVISRYNDASGIQISHGADSNTINYSYVYRNCDVAGHGGGADGFSPKLTAKNTIFNYCYAWDNSDDGWDAFDKEGDITDIITIKHSACWNNGNPDVFTGKYDYDAGLPLDKKMWTVQQLMESDPNFEKNYKNKKFNYDNGKINGEKALDWVTQATTAMNPNGFKFGSAYTPQNADIIRTCDFCAVFDHRGKGFDNNNSQKCTGYFTNCVAFNNKINYQLPYTFAKWSNNWSWGATKSEQQSTNQNLLTPGNTNSAVKLFYSIRDQIVKTVNANQFPDNINFDKAISGLQK
jgi:hypothetical protein